MIPIHTPKPKPKREDVTKKKNFQTLVENWLVSAALSRLNRRHLDGKPDHVSGNSHNVSTLALWLDTLAAEQFGDYNTDHDTDGAWSSKYRLSLDKIRASNERRARDVLETYWKPSKVEGRSQGGKHGAWDGTRKGKIPEWSQADLRPYWDLPARGRAKACMSDKKMSSATYYRIAAKMPDFFARLELERRERERIGPDLDRLLEP